MSLISARSISKDSTIKWPYNREKYIKQSLDREGASEKFKNLPRPFYRHRSTHASQQTSSLVKQSLYIVEEPQSTDLMDPTSLLNILTTGYLYKDSVIVRSKNRMKMLLNTK
jgi:hypothetical protein